MTSKRLYIKKSFVLFPLSVALSDLRKLVETGQASGLLLQTLAAIKWLDSDELVELLGREIALKPGIAKQLLHTQAGKLIVQWLHGLVKSYNSELSLHHLISKGVEQSLLDDGKLTLLELLEKMPGEAILYWDKIEAFRNALDGDDIQDFIGKTENLAESNSLDQRDSILWHFIKLSSLSKKSQQDLRAQIGINVAEDFAPVEDWEALIGTLKGERAHELLQECEVLAQDYDALSEHNYRILQCLARQCSTSSQSGSQVILSQDFNATVRSLQFSPNGSYLVAGSDDKSLRFWKTYDEGKTYVQQFQQGHKAEIRAVAFSPSGHLVASAGEDPQIKLWNPSTGEKIRVISRVQKQGIFSLKFINDDVIATGSWDQVIAISHVQTGALIRTFEQHTGAVWSLDTHPKKPLLISGSDDKTVRFWDLNNGSTVQILEGHQRGVFAVRVSPDGKIIATGSADHSIYLWNVNDGRHLATLDGHQSTILQLRFTADGRYLLSGSNDHAVKIWDLQSLKPLMTLSGHRNGVYGLDISPISSVVASGSWDKTLRLWQLDLTASF